MTKLKELEQFFIDNNYSMEQLQEAKDHYILVTTAIENLLNKESNK